MHTCTNCTRTWNRDQLGPRCPSCGFAFAGTAIKFAEPTVKLNSSARVEAPATVANQTGRPSTKKKPLPVRAAWLAVLGTVALLIAFLAVVIVSEVRIGDAGAQIPVERQVEPDNVVESTQLGYVAFAEGHCFNLDSTTPVSCHELHEYEVVLIREWSRGTEFPTVSEVQSAMYFECQGDMSDIFGDTSIDVLARTTSPQSWPFDRGIRCIASHPMGPQERPIWEWGL